MDLYCPRCADPVDNDYFHEVAEETGTTYREVAGAFRSKGCEALGDTCNQNHDTRAAMYVAAAYDLLGDDMDGAAAMLADFGF